MIIKSTRIPTAHTSRIATYLAKPAGNEISTWIRGCPEDLLLLGEISKIAGKQYSVRHFVISPNEQMSQQDFVSVFAEICFEYGVSNTSGNRASIVQHEKPRKSGIGNETHWHVAFPELDVETGRILSSRFTKLRNEKLARLCELTLGHRVVPGRFNKQVYRALEKERPALDLKPFETALREAMFAAGQDENMWLEYRARLRKQSRSPSNWTLDNQIV
ncbi:MULTISPECIES: hypothetical protein [unclassified Ruegeria]|uniref:hypothetical protein n=1 Tax=unclassified Ruegeria TaxID=2625375 RepID=UPI00147A1131|nr:MULTISPECIES: hypothetical protein [unclassified Ruegeria]